MDLSSLAIFVEVMQRRSFAEVARLHDIAPSTVSRIIASLEDELGIRLFHRSTRKLEPTESGLVYCNRVQPLVTEIESAKQMAIDLNKEPSGTLRITAPAVFGDRQIVPLLPELMEKYPELNIELMLTDAFLDLIEDRIDIAIRLGTLQDSSYIAKQLIPMQFYISASPTYIEQYGSPETPEQLTEHNCLLFPRTGYNLDWLFKPAQGEVKRINISGKYLITNSQAIRQCTLSGMGLSLLPDWLIDEDIKTGSLIHLFDDYEVTATDYESAAWIVYPSREYMPLKTRVFIDFLTQKIKRTK